MMGASYRADLWALLDSDPSISAYALGKKGNRYDFLQESGLNFLKICRLVVHPINLFIFDAGFFDSIQCTTTKDWPEANSRRRKLNRVKKNKSSVQRFMGWTNREIIQ